MKKLIALTASLLLATSAAFADRFLEFGVDVFMDVNENLLSANDILVKDLVIDLVDISDHMGKDGMAINATVSPSAYMNVNVGAIGGGIYTGVTVNGKFGFSKELFEFLAYGNEFNKPVEAKLNAGLQVYSEIAANAKFTIYPFKINVTPTLFVPVVYMPNPDAKVTLTMNEDGTIYAVANADYAIYTCTDMTGSVDTSSGFSIDTSALSVNGISDLLASGAGVDLAGSVTMPFLFNLELGGYARIPFIPAHLKYSVKGSASATATVNGVLDSAMSNATGSGSGSGDGQDPMYTYSTDFSPVTYGTDEHYSVNRPMRMGATATWAPFGDWFLINGSLGFGANNPFGKDFKFGESTYLEYSLGIDTTLLYVFNFHASTQYMQEIFAHSMGFKFNFYVMEVHMDVGVSSASFVKSFTGAGLTTTLGLSLGL